MTRKSDGVSPCDVIQSWSEKLMAARHMEIVNIDVILVEGVVVGPMSDRGKNVRRRLSPAERRIDPRAVALTSSRRVIRGIQRRKAIGPESATTAWPQGSYSIAIERGRYNARYLPETISAFDYVQWPWDALGRSHHEWLALLGGEVCQSGDLGRGSDDGDRKLGGEDVAFSEGRPTGSARLFPAQNNHCYGWWRSTCRHLHSCLSRCFAGLARVSN
ncbi:hypothetical protein KC320_g44 [Hortaea werneckii]|nr:hypothetical protein KC320_g44 [Hortaea werneckii]